MVKKIVARIDFIPKVLSIASELRYMISAVGRRTGPSPQNRT